ncbi:MAG: hypothetical protein IJW51_03545 [Clostridia bacterium]|nr:hypothetical protein [Clostridia bacterium]
MKHIEHYTVRWHDTNAALELRPTALLALMQETSNMQFVTSGRSLDVIREERGVGFILSRIAFDILRPLTAFDKIRVETFTCEGRGFTYPRGFEVFCGEELVARCHSLWALVNITDRTFVKCADFPLTFGHEPELLCEMPIRFRIPRDATFLPVGERAIAYSDLDYNMHMNNTKYPDMVCDFLPNPTSVRITGMALSYCHEAAFGDRLTVERAEGGEGVYYFRTKKGDTVCLEAMVTTEER